MLRMMAASPKQCSLGAHYHGMTPLLLPLDTGSQGFPPVCYDDHLGAVTGNRVSHERHPPGKT